MSQNVRLAIPSALRMVQICAQQAKLAARRRAGASLAPEEQRRLALLDNYLTDDKAQRRREQRRFATKLPVTLRIGGRAYAGRMLDVSGGGMFITAPVPLTHGSSVQVAVGPPSGPRYLFNCRLRRAGRCRGVRGYGLTYRGMPLEVATA